MKDILEQLMIAILASAISYYVVKFLPEVPTTIDFLQYVNHPGIRFVILIAILWYVLALAVRAIRRRVKEERRTPHGSVRSRAPRIRYTHWKGKVEHFGVDWKGEYGKPRTTADSVAVVDGPYCPECGAELMRDIKERYIRSDKPFWKCPGCSFQKSRPKRFLYEEKEAVRRQIERDVS